MKTEIISWVNANPRCATAVVVSAIVSITLITHDVLHNRCKLAIKKDGLEIIPQ